MINDKWYLYLIMLFYFFLSDSDLSLALPFPPADLRSSDKGCFLQIKGKSRVDQGKGLFFFLWLQKQRKKGDLKSSYKALPCIWPG